MAQKKMTVAQTAVEALDRASMAFEKIAEHEKECGRRWTEAKDELTKLKDSQEIHAKRWEKLAWMVGGCMIALTVASVTNIT